MRRIAYIPSGAFTNGKGHRVSLVTENEAGHQPTGNTPEGGDVEPWYWGNPNDEVKSYKEACATAQKYNLRLGISTEDEVAILVSSMKRRK